MTILATTGVDNIDLFTHYSKGYRLKETVKKDGSLGKPQKELFYINLSIEVGSDTDLGGIFRKINPEKSIIKTITLSGDLDGVTIPTNWKRRVFVQGCDYLTDGLINLVKVDTTNLKELFDLAKENPSYRFVGGTLLAVEGVPVGMFDEGEAKDFGILGKENSKILFKGEDNSYDSFSQLTFSELEDFWGKENILYEGIKVGSTKKLKSLKTKKKKEPKSTTKPKSKPKKPKVSKKKETFSKLFSKKVEF